MIKLIDERVSRFVKFLNDNYPTEEVVTLTLLHGYDSCKDDETEGNGFAVYIPPMRTILLPTEVPEVIKEEAPDLVKNFIIHNLAHEYAHFLQDVGVLRGWDDENIIEQVADEFADETVEKFEEAEQ